MSERDKVLNSVKKALAPLPERTAYPQWRNEEVISRSPKEWESPWAEFSERITALGGMAFDTPEGVMNYLRGCDCRRGYCDPELLKHFEPFAEGIELHTEFVRAEVDTYAFGITRATAVIAETGTIMLTDHDTPDRLGALAPWTHIAAVRKEDIVPTIPAAIAKFDDDPSIIWATGPSKTADVEGVLIKGVHGPGEQGAVLL